MKSLLKTLLVLALATQANWAKINVVTTSADLASIAGEIGKDRINVQSLAQGTDDLHFLAARPDFIMKTSRADVFVLIGGELEVGWVPLILQQSRNRRVQIGNLGYCDTSTAIKMLEKPTGTIDRQMGDMHPFGNPHYWLDPVNGIKMARTLVRCFSRVDKANAAFYQRNYEAFKKKVKVLTKRLFRLMKPHRGKEIIPFHSEIIYVVRRFGLKQPMTIEEFPGALPGPVRQRLVTDYIKKNKVRLVTVTPWNNPGVARRIARDGGAKLIILPLQTGSVKGTETYLKMVEYCITLLAKEL